MASKLENRNLDKVLEINEFIKTIDGMAALIKLNALNALFLAIRSGEKLRGYIVVTDEFNKFSAELMGFVDLLLVKIHQIVYSISDIIKQNHRLELYERIIKNGETNSMDIIKQFIHEHETKITIIGNEMQTNLENIAKLLVRNEKIILRGDMLATQAKIEGAYSAASKDVFLDVAVNFQKHIEKIRESLQNLRKMMNIKNMRTGM